MIFTKTKITILGLVVTLIFLLTNISSVQAQPGGPCVVEQGRFRNYDYGGNFPENWFESSVQQNQAQPYVYLDLMFSSGCVGQVVGVEILEADTFGVEGDSVFEDTSFTVSQNQNTFVFKAGEEECDSILNGPNCYHYLELKIDGETYDFSSSGVMGLSNAIGIYYENIGANYSWEYISFVNIGNLPSYAYSQYISPNDPDYISATALEAENDGGIDGENDGGIEAENDPQVLTAEDITEQIENPLGDGSSLPAFIESLLGIIVRAGIPLVVLALVYAGFRFVIAQGNPEKLNDAKKTLLYVVIGSLILLGAWTIATILNNTLNAILTSITSIIV